MSAYPTTIFFTKPHKELLNGKTPGLVFMQFSQLPNQVNFFLNLIQNNQVKKSGSSGDSKPLNNKKYRLVEAFKENVGTDGWSDEEISTLIDDLLESSGNDFNAVLQEINKLKNDMNNDNSESEKEEELEIDDEERERLGNRF